MVVYPFVYPFRPTSEIHNVQLLAQADELGYEVREFGVERDAQHKVGVHAAGIEHVQHGGLPVALAGAYHRMRVFRARPWAAVAAAPRPRQTVSELRQAQGRVVVGVRLEQGQGLAVFALLQQAQPLVLRPPRQSIPGPAARLSPGTGMESPAGGVATNCLQQGAVYEVAQRGHHEEQGVRGRGTPRAAVGGLHDGLSRQEAQLCFFPSVTGRVWT